MKSLVIAFALSVPFLGLSCIRIVKEIRFEQDCGGHLNNAAHANSVAMALPEMEISVAYLLDHKMTDGFTSILYRTPDENVGFWFNNLSAATEELRKESHNEKMTPLEQSNVLMKLHETIGKTGGPPGISIFPANVQYCVMYWIFLIPLIAGCGIVVVKLNDSI